MISKDLEGLKVSLNDERIVEDFQFAGDKVIATIGTKDGAVCAPILDLKIINPSALTIEGQGLAIKWEDVQITDSQILTIRNGKPAIYSIERKFIPEQRKRHLP